MSTSSGSRNYGRFDELAEEFAERYRRGERPSLQEYVDRLPEMAEEIREMFPALVEVEQVDEDSREDPPPPPAVLRQRQIGDYRIVREVGRGGMGVVYEAEQISLGRRVALKVLPGHVGDRKALTRFRREAKATARLHHTNIVPVFEVGSDGDTAFYAMQFIQGQGLDQVIGELERLRSHDRGPAGKDFDGLVVLEKLESGTDTACLTATTPRNQSLGQVAESLLTGRLGIEDLEPSLGVAPGGVELARTEAIDRSAMAGDKPWNTAQSLPERQSAGNVSSSAVLPGGTAVSTVESSRGGRLPFFRSVAQIGRQTAQGLAHAHERGVVHRDIKPSNLLLDTTGVVWITDFGLAKADDDGLTQTGDILGTLRYMAPERFRGEGDTRTDIYALGLTLYEMLTLKPAFDTNDRLKLIERVKNEEPIRPRSLDSRIPRDLETIILKAIDKDPARRYATADAMAEDLRRFLSDEPIEARRASTTERFARWARHHPGIAAAGALLTAFLIVATVASLVAAQRFASLANRQSHSAFAERTARIESDHARKAAQLAERETKKIAAQAETDKETAQRDSYRSTIKLAESMLQGDVQARYRVADILWAAQPDLRGWEWGHLMAQCPLEEWSLQTNQEGIDLITASADGRYLATAGLDKSVCLWDSWTRKQIWRTNIGHHLHTIEIDPRSRYLGIGSGDDSAPNFRILDISTGQVVHQGAEKGQGRLAFSPTGSHAYVLSPARLDRLDTRTWSLGASIPKPKPEEWHNLRLFVDAAGTYVGVHAVDGPDKPGFQTIRRMALFDAKTLRPVTDFDANVPTLGSRLLSVATPFLHSGVSELLHSDGPNLFRTKLVLDANLSIRREPIINHPDVISWSAYDHRSQTAIAASPEGTVTLRDGDGETRTLLHGSPIRGLALLTDGRLITAGHDGLIKCWKPEQSAKLALNTDAGPSGASDKILAFTHGGKNLLYRTWEWDRHYLYDTKSLSFRTVPTPGAQEFGERLPLFQPGTNELLVPNATSLQFYRLGRNGISYVKSRSIDFARPLGAAFDASGRVLVASSRDQRMAAFDTNSLQQFPAPKARGLGVVSVNPTGTQAALVTATSLQVWEVATGRLLNRLDWGAESFYPPSHQGDRINRRGEWVPLKAAIFHPTENLVAVVQDLENSGAVVLWDTALGKERARITAQPGIRINSCDFSADGNRLFAPCTGGTVRIFDWRLGKELFALSDAAHAVHVAINPDGVTIAYSGWNPSLRIAKSLPWTKVTQRNADFYRAMDDLWTYSIELSPSVKNRSRNLKESGAALADEAEILGDVERRRGGPAEKVLEHYARAIQIRQRQVLANSDKAESLYRLATVYEKCLASDLATNPTKRMELLQQTAQFWRKLANRESVQQAVWRYCLDYQLRLLDGQLAEKGADAKQFVLSQIQLWCELSEKEANGPPESLRQFGVRAFWNRLVVAAPEFLSDQHATVDLVRRHPQLTAPVGNDFVAAKNWERAVAIFSQPITKQSGFDHVHGLLALSGAEIGEGGKQPLDDLARAKLRQHALDSLKGELTALSKRAESDPSQDLQHIADTLRLWTEDLELARVREAQALAKLTADERNAWKALWTDVASLRERLPAPKLVETNNADDSKALAAAHRRAHEISDSHPREAEALFRGALEGFRKIEGPDSHLVFDLTHDLALLFSRTGRDAEAEPLFRECLERARGQAEHSTLGVPQMTTELGLCLLGQGKWTEAEPILRQAIDAAREQFGADDPRAAAAMATLGMGLIENEKWVEAEPYLRECLTIREKSQPDEWSTFNVRSMLGGSLLGQKKFDEAEPLIVSGYEGMKAREAKIPLPGKPRLEEAAGRVVKLYKAWGKPEKAADWRVKLAKAIDGPKP